MSRLVPDLLSSMQSHLATEMGAVVDYEFIFPYERKKAEYDRNKTANLIFHVDKCEVLSDSPHYATGNAIPLRVKSRLRVRQKLIDQEAADYGEHTYERLWSLTIFLASRLDQTRFLPEQWGVMEVTGIEERDTEGVQEQRGAMELIISMQGEFVVDRNVALALTTQRTISPTSTEEDAPIIDVIDLNLQAEH